MTDDVAFRPVPVGSKDLLPYSLAAGEERVGRLRHRAAGLAGARILHVSSTPYGGGVAEHLGTHLPLLRDLGLEAEWQVLSVPDDFLQVTKAMHNGLQGMDIAWTPRMEQVYLDTLRRLAPTLADSWDYVVVHDPQPAALLTHVQDDGRFAEARWVWRCHIDLSTVNERIWEFLHPHVERYAATIWTMADYVPSSLSEHPKAVVFPPGIDPLAGKNIELNHTFARELCKVYGVDPKRPVVCQVSRFDPWKDPVGLIRSFDAVHEAVPAAQLVLIGSLADDDPEGPRYRQLADEEQAGRDHVRLLTDVDDFVVNAFQRLARVVVQKSLREGFGLTVSEAMWKGRPVVATRAGGLRLQVRNGQDGYLVDSDDGVAPCISELLQDPAAADAMGASGREHVRDRFLLTRELEDYLCLLADLSSSRSDGDGPSGRRPAMVGVAQEKDRSSS